MGQQVGNCKFHIAHYLADLFAMHRGPTRSIPLCIQHHIQLTFLSFQMSRPSHSWDTAFSKFHLENPRSRSSVRSKFKVTTCVQHPINSNPVFFMSIHPPIPMTHIFSKFHLEKSSVKVIAQGHNRYNILSTHIPFVSCRSVLLFLRYSYFKIWPWKSKLKVIPQGHIVCITSYRLTSLSFHADRSSHSLDTATSKFDLENSRSRSWVRSKFEVTKYVSLTSYRLTSLLFQVNGPSYSWDTALSQVHLENPRSRS